MRCIDVVALEESFRRNLPVGARLLLRRGNELEVIWQQRRNTREFIERRARGGCVGDEDDPAMLGRGKLDEAVITLVHARKSVLVRDVFECTVEAIGPTMIR